ncbi:hypothetical protein ACFVHQ_07030 [Actinomycetes bacterium NPDC127524]
MEMLTNTSNPIRGEIRRTISRIIQVTGLVSRAAFENKIFQNMSRKATCADKASMENFFGVLKQEMDYGEILVGYEE